MTIQTPKATPTKRKAEGDAAGAPSRKRLQVEVVVPTSPRKSGLKAYELEHFSAPVMLPPGLEPEYQAALVTAQRILSNPKLRSRPVNRAIVAKLSPKLDLIVSSWAKKVDIGPEISSLAVGAAEMVDSDEEEE